MYQLRIEMAIFYASHEMVMFSALDVSFSTDKSLRAKKTPFRYVYLTRFLVMEFQKHKFIHTACIFYFSTHQAFALFL